MGRMGAMNATTESLLMVLDNDRTAYDYCMGMVALALETAPDLDPEDYGGAEQPEIARWWLADGLQEHFETITDDAGLGLKEPASLIVAQLYQRALEDVEWNDVADHYLRKHREGVTA
jgi:hypothetical protein